jgi:hypothetical protein
VVGAGSAWWTKINPERNRLHVVVHNVADDTIYYTHCINMNNWFSSANWRKADKSSSGADRVRREDTTRCWMVASDSICNLAPSYQTAKRSTQRFLVSPLDYYRVFEMFNENTSVKTKVIGYTFLTVRYFDPTSDKTPATGSWQDIDISADTGSNPAIGAVVTVMNTSGVS